MSDTSSSAPPSAGAAPIEEWLRLNAALAFRPQEALPLLRSCGDDPARALAVLATSGARVGVPAMPAARRMAARLEEARVRALPWTSPLYPPALRVLSDAPPLLFLRGDPAALSGPALAIVGSRAATRYGLETAERMAAAAARAGAVVVSGLALGIDAAAHRGALDAGGRSVAVQACGLDEVYPKRHRRLALELRERGCLIGELPLGTPPRPPHFPMRNRLIAALGRRVLVVEARARSGSLVTARHALDQGGDVLVIPGPITSAASEGPNRLLRDGATAVLEERDLLEALGLGCGAAPAQASLPLPAGPDAQRLVGWLEHEALAEDELRARLGGAPGELELALLELELDGRAERDRDGRWRVRSVAPGSRDPKPRR